MVTGSSNESKLPSLSKKRRIIMINLYTIRCSIPDNETIYEFVII